MQKQVIQQTDGKPAVSFVGEFVAQVNTQRKGSDYWVRYNGFRTESGTWAVERRLEFESPEKESLVSVDFFDDEKELTCEYGYSNLMNKFYGRLGITDVWLNPKCENGGSDEIHLSPTGRKCDIRFFGNLAAWVSTKNKMNNTQRWTTLNAYQTVDEKWVIEQIGETSIAGEERLVAVSVYSDLKDMTERLKKTRLNEALLKRVSTAIG